MARTVRHLSLHRINGTELQVLSEIEAGTLPVIEAEEAVIRAYAEQGPWPHREVSLFILQDLQPLVRQLRPGADLPPGGAAALDSRPVVNAYDLADLSSCHVFLNWHTMQQEKYSEDPEIIQGLLAHEHAHPLAENETTRASRRLQVQIAVEGWPPESSVGRGLRAAPSGPPPLPSPRPRGQEGAGGGAPAGGGGWLEEADHRERVDRLLALMAETLCVYAPREVFASELAIRRGFGRPLLHLDQANVDNSLRSLAGREQVQRHLQKETDEGRMSPAAARLLLLMGDLKGYVDLGLEVAAFHRAGRDGQAQELAEVLESDVFPHLEPQVPRLYATLLEQYVALRADLKPIALLAWCQQVLTSFTDTLAEDGLVVRYALSMAEN
jgi:hypothetical protein